MSYFQMNDQNGWGDLPSGAGRREYGGDVGGRAALEGDGGGDRVRGEDDRRRLHRGRHAAEERQEAGQEAAVAARAEPPRLDAALLRQTVDLHVALAHALPSAAAATVDPLAKSQFSEPFHDRTEIRRILDKIIKSLSYIILYTLSIHGTLVNNSLIRELST